MTTLAALLFTSALATAQNSDVSETYENCVKGAQSDAAQNKCLEAASRDMDQAMAGIVDRLKQVLAAKPETKSQASLLNDAHSKWLPSRDADCKLQAAVTMEDPADAADAERLCAYQADVPRYRLYQRFLGFVNN